jgi:hypothetical protein
MCEPEHDSFTTNKYIIDPKNTHQYGLIVSNPKVLWMIHLFGKDNNEIVVHLTRNPRWFYRFTTSLILGWYWVKAPI